MIVPKAPLNYPINPQAKVVWQFIEEVFCNSRKISSEESFSSRCWRLANICSRFWTEDNPNQNTFASLLLVHVSTNQGKGTLLLPESFIERSPRKEDRSRPAERTGLAVKEKRSRHRELLTPNSSLLTSNCDNFFVI